MNTEQVLMYNKPNRFPCVERTRSSWSNKHTSTICIRSRSPFKRLLSRGFQVVVAYLESSKNLPTTIFFLYLKFVSERERESERVFSLCVAFKCVLQSHEEPHFSTLCPYIFEYLSKEGTQCRTLSEDVTQVPYVLVHRLTDTLCILLSWHLVKITERITSSSPSSSSPDFAIRGKKCIVYSIFHPIFPAQKTLLKFFPRKSHCNKL